MGCKQDKDIFLIVTIMRVLILCTGNSCRSQMAEGILKSLARNWDVFSAGTEPADKVNPNAVSAMAEIGIDISENFPKSVDKFLPQYWDYVISVCGNADKNCPIFKGKVGKRLHIPFDDPAKFEGDPESIKRGFARVRDEIKAKFREFINNL